MSSLKRLLALAGLAQYANSAAWTYSEPENWGKEYPKCDLPFQSPVNINAEHAIYLPDSDLPDLQLSWIGSRARDYEMVNNGHALEVKITGKGKTLSGGAMGDKAKFNLAQFHLHWPSEHEINGELAEAEIHFVHMLEGGKSCEAEGAAAYAHGISVLGVMIVEGEANPHIQKMIDALPEVTEAKTSTQVRLELGKLVPEDAESAFYHYSGSLTTPPCFQSVVWNVARTPLTMSREQLDSLKTLLHADGTPIVDNHRPALPLGPRRVFRSFGGYGCTSTLCKSRPAVTPRPAPLPVMPWSENRPFGTGFNFAGITGAALNNIADVTGSGFRQRRGTSSHQRHTRGIRNLPYIQGIEGV